VYVTVSPWGRRCGRGWCWSPCPPGPSPPENANARSHGSGRCASD
jgi:hypothetical protein